jgi:hypothetical protein
MTATGDLPRAIPHHKGITSPGHTIPLGGTTHLPTNQRQGRITTPIKGNGTGKSPEAGDVGAIERPYIGLTNRVDNPGVATPQNTYIVQGWGPGD